MKKTGLLRIFREVLNFHLIFFLLASHSAEAEPNLASNYNYKIKIISYLRGFHVTYFRGGIISTRVCHH